MSSTAPLDRAFLSSTVNCCRLDHVVICCGLAAICNAVIWGKVLEEIFSPSGTGCVRVSACQAIRSAIPSDSWAVIYVRQTLSCAGRGGCFRGNLSICISAKSHNHAAAARSEQTGGHVAITRYCWAWSTSSGGPTNTFICVSAAN